MSSANLKNSRLPYKLFTNKLETIELYFVYIERTVLVQTRYTKYSLSFNVFSYLNLVLNTTPETLLDVIPETLLLDVIP